MPQNLVRTVAIVLLGASALLAFARTVVAGEPLLVVRVYDTSDATSDIRSAAIQTAAAIVSEAGVAAEWRDCTNDSAKARCQSVPGRRDLIVRIMPEVTPGSTFRRSSLQLHTTSGEISLPLGIAVIDPVSLVGEMATIFHEQVRTIARQSGVDNAELLGRAVAHEIGHLLLQARSHSRTGLMRGAWSREDLMRNRREDWVFSPGDRQKLQLGAAARTAAR
jgi:hypothetical protein